MFGMSRQMGAWNPVEAHGSGCIEIEEGFIKITANFCYLVLAGTPCFFQQAPAGTGKTYMLAAYVKTPCG